MSQEGENYMYMHMYMSRQCPALLWQASRLPHRRRTSFVRAPTLPMHLRPVCLVPIMPQDLQHQGLLLDAL